MPVFKTFVIFALAGFLSLCASAFKNPISTYAEDGYILQAFDALESGDFKRASGVYEELFLKSGKLEYLGEAIEMQIFDANYKRALVLLEQYFEKDRNNAKLNRVYPEVLLATGAKVKALSEAKKLIECEKVAENYEVLGRIYFARGELEGAAKAYESAFELSKDERLLIVISDIYFGMKNPNKAISLLEMNVSINGCSLLICDRLNAIYGERREFAKQQRILEKLYDSGEELSAYPLLNLLLKRNDYAAAIKLLEKSGINDEVLLDLYRLERRFVDAQRLAGEIYARTKNLDVLGVLTLLEYENAKDKNNQKLLQSTRDNLEKIILKNRKHTYLNFLGYMLIDHGMDIERGIELVKEALKQAPDTPHYIDSLAWGYYKLRRCKEAQKEMERLSKEEREAEEEILEHYKKIRQCAEKNRVKNP